MMDLIRARALVRVIAAACDELLQALKEDTPARAVGGAAPAVDRTVKVTGWYTPNRIEFLRHWYPTYASSALIFRAVRGMDGPPPGSDAVIVTYVTQRMQLKRPADIRTNSDAVARASAELCDAVGFDRVVAVRSPAKQAPAPAAAGPGAALWHPWATIKELARRDGVILDGLDDLPGYNKRREARGLAPLYLKTFKMGQS